MTFSDDIKKYNIKAQKTVSKIRRASALQLLTNIVLSTPVDKGTLRQNWFVALNAPELGSIDAVGDDASRVLSKAQTTLNGEKIEDVIFITNNLPYASRIEYDGWSAQAPAGMVRINIEKWSKIVDANVRRFKNG